MYLNKRIGVVVPAYNEERFILSVISTMPEFVDKIYVVNDASTDKTGEIISREAIANTRLTVIKRTIRGGVGAAVITGHRKALQDNIDVSVVMAGDGQMDPTILKNFIEPIVDGTADYAKGNRLSSRNNRKEMPVGRSFGNFLLTNLSRISSGYYRISDPQNGYTAISAKTLKKLDLDGIEQGFAFENDMLIKLNCIGVKVVDISHPARYRGQQSKIRYLKFVLRTSWILTKGFIWRIWTKYVKRTFTKPMVVNQTEK
jgi:glycosyltransferase involved in cell wall biosynthesis